MYCASCGSKIPDSARFCTKCGVNIPGDTDEQCAKCQTKLKHQARYCTGCGIDFQSIQPEPEKPSYLYMSLTTETVEEEIEPGNPKGWSYLFKRILEHAGVDIVKHLPMMVVLFLVATLFHTYLLVAHNHGVGAGTWIGVQALATQGGSGSAIVLWGVASALLAAALTVINQHGFGQLVTNIISAPKRMSTHVKTAGADGLMLLFAGVGLALIVSGILSSLASLAMAVALATLTNSRAGEAVSAVIRRSWKFVMAVFGPEQAIEASRYTLDHSFSGMVGASIGFLVATLLPSPSLLGFLVLIVVAVMIYVRKTPTNIDKTTTAAMGLIIAGYAIFGTGEVQAATANAAASTGPWLKSPYLTSAIWYSIMPGVIAAFAPTIVRGLQRLDPAEFKIRYQTAINQDSSERTAQVISEAVVDMNRMIAAEPSAQAAPETAAAVAAPVAYEIVNTATAKIEDVPTTSAGYQEQGLGSDGYDAKGYNAAGYDRQGYDAYGFTREGFDSEGYNRQGYDREGYDRHGISKDGIARTSQFNAQGYDMEGFNLEGQDIEGYDRQGYNSEGYDRKGFNREGYDRQGYDALGYDQEGWDAQGFNRQGFDRQGFDLKGFDKEGFNCRGFDGYGFNRQGFDEEGYNRQGFDWEGFDRKGYDKDGFNRQGLDGYGFSREGFDAAGFGRQGLDKDGFDRKGFDKDGYDRQGFNALGFNRSGWDAEGYNRQGFDKAGFDRSGLDKDGYNRAGFDARGFNREGWNMEGWNAQGYNRQGFDKTGYDRNGIDKQGYDRQGYDGHGFDRVGFDRQGYDRQGFDKGGFSRDGFDSRGYNRQGFDRYGFDLDGFDLEGFDKQGFNKEGYDRTGFNRYGLDRSGHTREDKPEPEIKQESRQKIETKVKDEWIGNRSPKSVDVLSHVAGPAGGRVKDIFLVTRKDSSGDTSQENRLKSMFTGGNPRWVVNHTTDDNLPAFKARQLFKPDNQGMAELNIGLIKDTVPGINAIKDAASGYKTITGDQESQDTETNISLSKKGAI